MGKGCLFVSIAVLAFTAYIGCLAYITFGSASPIDDEVMLPLPASLVLEFDSGTRCNEEPLDSSGCSREFIVTSPDGDHRTAMDVVAEHLGDAYYFEQQTSYSYGLHVVENGFSLHHESENFFGRETRVSVSSARNAWSQREWSVANAVANAMWDPARSAAPTVSIDRQRSNQRLEELYGAEFERLRDSAVIVTFSSVWEKPGGESYY